MENEETIPETISEKIATFDKLPTTDFDGEIKIFPKKALNLFPNAVTCFVGCNGSGKTTLIDYIIQALRKQDAEKICTPNPFSKCFSSEEERDKPHEIYYSSFDKSEDDGIQEEYFFKHFAINAQSTGESIIYRFGGTLTLLGSFIRDPKNNGKTLFIFFDDCDAGTSIDAINDILDVLTLIKQDCAANNITYYIILTANSFEMCRNVDYRIDVTTFNNVDFSDYEQYKSFILKSRRIKDKRK